MASVLRVMRSTNALAMSAVWLVQRKDQKSPMAKAFVDLITRKTDAIR